MDCLAWSRAPRQDPETAANPPRRLRGRDPRRAGAAREGVPDAQLPVDLPTVLRLPKSPKKVTMYLMADNVRIVWLLGAGFSRSLGGPLLAHLFRPRSRQSDLERFPDVTYPNLADELFHTRACFNAGKRDGLWEDAEEFLVFVDDAYRKDNNNGVKLRLLQELGGRMDWGYEDLLPAWRLDRLKFRLDAFKDFGRGARRSLAAECSAFLLELDPNDERWRPYEEWVRGLQPHKDTVICFNYDRVLETLEGRVHGALKSLLPSECPNPPSDDLNWNCVPVLKLHGSVDWRKSGPACPIVREDAHKLLISTSETPFIAAPGRSKQEAVNEFRPLWDLARHHLRQADVLVVLGYGFPASDAMARTEIQMAFRGGNPKGRVKRVDFVLGPYVDRPESRRVHALLETSTDGRQIVWYPDPPVIRNAPGSQAPILYLTVHRLWAEDFIFDYKLRTRI